MGEGIRYLETVETRVIYRRDYDSDRSYKDVIKNLYVFNGWKMLKQSSGSEGPIYAVLMKEIIKE